MKLINIAVTNDYSEDGIPGTCGFMKEHFIATPFLHSARNIFKQSKVSTKVLKQENVGNDDNITGFLSRLNNLSQVLLRSEMEATRPQHVWSIDLIELLCVNLSINNNPPNKVSLSPI